MLSLFDNFKLVIRECDYSNTYKMAWAKGIVELSTNYIETNAENVFIPLEMLAEKMIKYYWNQTIFFNLFQSAPNQIPVIKQEVDKLIFLYQDKTKDYKPIIFDKAKFYLKENFLKEYSRAIKDSIVNIKGYVFKYFKNLEKQTYPFYELSSQNEVIFKTKFLKEIALYEQDLLDLINYRWSLMLENYNSCPRICKKVRVNADEDIKRTALTKFDKFLDLENKEHICFICQKPIEDHDLSRDHVIPWSYMYSDDLWNIVYVHKSCNSIKSNKTPDKSDIELLKLRNIKLQQCLHDTPNIQSRKILQDFDYAVEHNLVDSFYSGFKGC